MNIKPLNAKSRHVFDGGRPKAIKVAPMDDTTKPPSDDAPVANRNKAASDINAAQLALSAIEVLSDSIPAELRDQAFWIVWRLEPPDKAGDAPRKMPYQAANHWPAKSNDASTWGTFGDALAAYNASRPTALLKMVAAGKLSSAKPFSGIGYVFAKGVGIVGIDLDNCRNPDTGELAPWAIEIIERFATYAEISPSGTGIKLWCRGRLPIDGTGRKIEYRDGAVEMYQHGRYFAVTGHKLPNVPGTVNDAQQAIDWLWAKAFAKTNGQPAHRHNGRLPGGCEQDRTGVLERARKYLATMPPAVSGQRGHDATFRAACVLVQGFALSTDAAYPLLAEYNERCEPPWSERELRHKLEDADKQPGERGCLLNGAERAPPSFTVEAADAANQVSGEILSFDARELPEFPTHVLPTVLRDWIAAESHATQTPADLAGLLALAVCAATIARKVDVEPRPGFREPVNLFVAVLLGPGNRKSAVFADAMRPLRDLETELIESARPIVARAESERRQAESRLRRLEKTAAEKGDAESRHDAGELAARLADDPEPVLPRLIVDDATSEKLGIMLAEQAGRIASMSPEGGVFDLMAGLYSKSGIPQFNVYLMGHAGDDLTTDRVSRKSVRVSRPALTCAYAMQPQVIEGLASNPAFRGRGLLARFLYAAPESWIGRREIAAAPVPDGTRDAYYRMVRRLANQQGKITLRLTSDALSAFTTWETEIEAMLGDGGEMEIMRDWGAKLAGATLRLAGVLHCIEHGPELPIGKATIAAAIEVARYLVPHAEAVLNMMLAKEDSRDDDARYLLRWIERHQRREFSKTEAHHHGKRRFKKVDDIEPALNELIRRGYIRPRPSTTTGPGRPPSPGFEVNPALFDGESRGKRSHNSHNVNGQPTAHVFGNIGNAFECGRERGEL